MQQNSPQLMYGYVVSTKTVTQPTNDVIFYLTNRRLHSDNKEQMSFFLEQHLWIFYMLFPIQKHEKKSPVSRKSIRPFSIHHHFQILAIK